MKIACYCRVSTENQIENYSIDEQRERLAAFCKAKGVNDTEFFVDAGWSGGNLERPAMRRMLEKIRLGEIQTVAVCKLDRLSRSQKDTLYLIEDVFEKYGVSLVSLCENFDTGTPFGKAMTGILSVFAQLEKERIAERFTMGRVGRAKSGLFHGGGNAPTGYDYVNGHLEINELEAAAVREIFARFLKGESVRAVQRNVCEKYGFPGNPSTVYNILKNSLYIGRVKFGGREYAGEHTPIISESDFFAANMLLSKRSPGENKPFRAGYLLSGLVMCACNAPCHANHGYYKCSVRAKTSKNIGYVCHNPYIAISELDELVKDVVMQLSVQLPEFEQLPLDDHSKALAALCAKEKRITELYENAGITLEQALGKLREISRQKQALSPPPTAPSDSFPEPKNVIAEFFANADLSESRALLRSLISRVVITPAGDVEIHWKI